MRRRTPCRSSLARVLRAGSAHPARLEPSGIRRIALLTLNYTDAMALDQQNDPANQYGLL